MAEPVPRFMKGLVLASYGSSSLEAINSLRVQDVPVPTPRRGQVLVQIEAAPANPSDLLLLQGRYGTLKTLPTVPGWEGAGRVVASGGGIMARWLVGKRVACAVQGNRSGTWAEYCVANASECIPLKRRLPIEQGVCLIINPLTAVGLLKTARSAGHRAAIHTAGASQLGQMIVALAADHAFPMIHVVRREAMVDELRQRGAVHVLNSSRDTFAQELQELAGRLSATAAFEAVAGKMTGTVLNAMPTGSTVYLYGALSQEPCGSLDPIELIFREKNLTGFFLGAWLKRQRLLSILRDVNRVQGMLIDGRLHSHIYRRVALFDAPAALLHYAENMSAGKVLITPHR